MSRSDPSGKPFLRTLVLSWSVPPAGSGSGVVMANLLRQFRREEMVVVGAYAVNYPKLVWLPDRPRIYYGMLQLPGNWRGERWFRRIQFPVLFMVSLYLALVYRCEAILAVFPDELFLLSGYLLSGLLRKPLFTYFHNTFLDDRTYEGPPARWLQPRVFRRARHMFVMSEGMLAFFRQKYPALKCSALVHSFNEPLPDPEGVSLPPLHSPLRLAFQGNVNESCAEAASRMFQLVQRRPDLVLNVYSGAMDGAWLSRLGFGSPNISVNSLLLDELLDHLQDADIFIHPHGFTGSMSAVEYQTIFPTRTIEFLLGQRPILAHVPADSYIARFYREHECALIVDEPTVEALEKGLQRLVSDAALRQRLVRNALKAARKFWAPDVADHLRQVLGEGN